MEFKYEKKFENNEKWYTLGIIRGLIENEEIYAVEIMDPAGKEMCDPDEWKPGSVAVAVFGVTEDEYNSFSENIEAFDALVDRLKADIPKDRLFAERNCVRKTDRKDTIDENGEFKKYIGAKVQKNAPKLDKMPEEIIKQLLAADKICVAYSKDTDRPILNVVNDRANLIMTVDEEEMDKFVKAHPNVYKKVFLENVINCENEPSIFVYFHKIGINMLGFLLGKNKVLNFPLEAVLGHADFVAKKPEKEISNPELERHVTCLYQLLRGAKPDDKNKEVFNKNMKYLDIKVMEGTLDGRFLLGQRAQKKEDGRIEFALSVVEQKETGERLVAASTCDEEFWVGGDGFEKIVVDYPRLKDIVEKSGVDGFVVNCRSKCSFKFTKQKLLETEKFRAWREEQRQKNEEK